MFPASVDNLLSEIASLKDRNSRLASEMNDQIQTLQMELRFLKMFIWFLPRRSRKKLYIRATVGKGGLGVYGDRDRALDLAASKFLQVFELRKQKIREDCLHLLDFSSQCKFSSCYELLQFINCTLSNLRNLMGLKAGTIASVRMQVRALIKRLRMFRNFVKFTEERFFFGIDIQDWACKVACVSTLYWVDQMEEAMADRLNAVLSNLLQMVKSCSPEVLWLYIRVLKTSKFLPFETFEMGEVVASFVDFILPTGSMKLLRQELAFLVAFLMDPLPPNRLMNEKDWNLVLENAKAVGSEIPSLICSLSVVEMNQGTAEERNALLGDFQEKTSKVKAEVRKFCVQNANSSRPRFPITDALGFLDLLLENFGNLMDTLISKVSYIPFAKDQLVTLHRDLVSLGPSLKKVHGLQNQLKELKDFWLRINDVAYQVEYVIDSCQMAEVPVWYNLVCLSDLIEEMKFIKREIWEIMQKQPRNYGVFNAKVNSGNIHLDQANTLGPDEVVVGFKDEAETIINRLTRGSMKLDIVSIIGMPGQGKTTLAKKVYNSPSVRYHFNKCVWCFVTQVYEAKMLLLDILRDVTAVLEDEICNMSKEGLSQKLYKCLKGQRYLIIMDDIWDITAWNALKESFPDDNNGSRILFTSRNKLGCNPLLLRPLSEEESMELIKHKLFFKDGWPSNFSCDVQKILEICNGLPLAVVVVAGLLNRVSNNVDQWRQTVQDLDSKLASEGCVDILELSYKHLPDFLKPCFLYLGAVSQAKVFKVHKLIQLWIAEGFVRKSGINSLEDVAIKYLEGLIERSLVIVNKRNFTSGEVKECRLHDLLREFCLRKAEEERFMHFSELLPYSLELINYEQYRLCLHRSIANACPNNTSPIVRSLLIYPSEDWDKIFPANLYFGGYSRLKLLRVLDLANLCLYDSFPEEIGSLICLRYLAVWSFVTVIPSSIGNLCNLQTFLVGGWKNILQLPRTIWKMKTLRNMAVGGRAAIVLEDCDANVCAQLDNLDSFSSLYLSNVEEAEQILRRFPRVRKLKLVFSKSWYCRMNCDQFQVLHFLSKLESLNLQYSSGAAHSCSFNFPRALKKLTLSELKCPWSQISTIGKLPNLEVLKFLNDAIVGKRWDVGDEEFLKLKYLKLSRLDISHWEASDSSFPCLEKLVVRDCPFLVELPSIFVDIITLNTIEIHGCGRGLGNSAKSILDEQREIGKEDLEVLISNVLYDGLDEDIPTWLVKSFESSYETVGLLKEDIILCKKVARPNVRKRLELDKKGVPRSVACFEKRFVPKVRRSNLVRKHNCEPRQAIMSRHSKEELKKDG